MLLSRVHNLDNAEASRSLAAAHAVKRPVQRLMFSPLGGGDPRPLAASWKETVPDHSHVYLQSSIGGPEDESESDGDKIADWNRFFDGFTKRVDAPRWGVKDLLVDNLEGITACDVDCDRNGLVRNNSLLPAPFSPSSPAPLLFPSMPLPFPLPTPFIPLLPASIPLFPPPLPDRRFWPPSRGRPAPRRITVRNCVVTSAREPSNPAPANPASLAFAGRASPAPPRPPAPRPRSSPRPPRRPAFSRQRRRRRA